MVFIVNNLLNNFFCTAYLTGSCYKDENIGESEKKQGMIKINNEIKSI